MKTDELKNAGHEVAYVILITVILITLTAIIFPLFIGLLPLLLVGGCIYVWNLDHMRNRRNAK